jgi:hypothetical protein
VAVNNGGFKTAQPSMLTKVMPGVNITPLLTVGDVLSSGYRYEAIPDGISVRPRGQGRVDLFVNHETSKVPFPYNAANPTAANGENDFDNSQVSKLILNQHSAGVLNGSFAISSTPVPAVLLQLPRHEEGRVQSGHLLHERGAPDASSGRRRRGLPIGDLAELRRASPSRSTCGPDCTTRSTAWAGTTTRTTSRSPGIGGRSSGDDTFTSGALPSPARHATSVPAQSQLTLHRAEHERAARR